MHKKSRKIQVSLFLIAITLYVAFGSSISFAQSEQNPSAPRVPAEQIAAARAWINPFPATPENMAQGKTLFEGKGQCTPCHGLEGRGDGIAAASLNPSPRNFHNPNLRTKTDGEFFWVLKNGIAGTGMISFVPGIVSEDEAALIILYERSLHGTESVPDLRVTDLSIPTLDLSVPFGGVIIERNSDRIILLSNKGNTDLEFPVNALSGLLSAPFNIQEDLCSGKTLPPRDSCTLSIRFSPTGAGEFSNKLDIASNDQYQNPAIIRVTGTGILFQVNKAPTAPQLISPENGVSGLGSDVKLIFKSSEDTDGDPVAYLVMICEDADFTLGCIVEELVASAKQKSPDSAGLTLSLIFGIVMIGASRNRKKLSLFMVALSISSLFLISCGGGGGGASDSTGADSRSELTDTIVGLKTASTYHWKVIADDGNGGLTESAPRHFTTQ